MIWYYLFRGYKQLYLWWFYVKRWSNSFLWKFYPDGYFVKKINHYSNFTELIYLYQKNGQRSQYRTIYPSVECSSMFPDQKDSPILHAVMISSPKEKTIDATELVNQLAGPAGNELTKIKPSMISQILKLPSLSPMEITMLKDGLLIQKTLTFNEFIIS